MRESIFFRAVHGHVIVAAHAGVDELNHDFLANSFQVAIAPGFKREGGSLAATFFHGALVGSAGGMGFDFIRLAIHDVHAAAIGLPAGDAGSEMLVGVGDALVVLFFVFVLFSVGRGITTLPESFDEIVALFVVRELLEGGTFLVADNPDYVLIEPLFVGALDFLGVVLHLLLFLLGVDGTMKRVGSNIFGLGLRCFCRRSGWWSGGALSAAFWSGVA